jgi:cation diffusion facilitator CzcD-associated flavoprotein CzcO
MADDMGGGIGKTLSVTVDRWLAQFEAAISQSDRAPLEALFHQDAHWRDLLAFTWDVKTVSGAETIVAALLASAVAAKPSRFKIDTDRTPPRLVTRAGTEIVEAIFCFRIASGSASGVLRLLPDEAESGNDSDTAKAWTLLTALEEIEGFPETVGQARPTGEVYSRDFSGPNWLDRRQSALTYVDRDPVVLVVGAGQAGLSVAARLTQLGVDTLIVDREDRVGDNWRNRYHALTLHNQVHVNHLPYMPFPPNWPKYIPKDKIAGWFEAYVESLEINVWTATEFAGGSYDEGDGKWSVTLRLADGAIREMRPTHVVMATGVSGIPSLPDIPSLKAFGGAVMHTSDYKDGHAWAGRNVVIIGTGNSGHDIAQDLQSHGASVTMVQRSPTTIVSVEPGAQIPYALYDEGPSLEDCDLLVASMPLQLTMKAHQLITQRTKELDKKLLDGLSRVGFKTDFGADDTGWQFKYLERGGGYYFTVGCSDMIADGEIGLIQFADIETFVAEGVKMRGGDILPADLVVLATGFKGQEVLVRTLFGDDIADRVGGIWGLDPALQELRNMWTRTGQPGLWFIAGSFAQCRIYSKYLGLQIKASEEGMIPLGRGVGEADE